MVDIECELSEAYKREEIHIDHTINVYNVSN